MCGGITAGMRD